MQSVRSKSRAAAAAPLKATSMGMVGMGMPTEEADDLTSEACSDSASSFSRVSRIRVGNRNLAMHSELVEMTDSTPLLQSGDFAALRARLEDQGFLLLRGLIPRATVEAARHKMLRHLASKGATREGTEWSEAVIELQSVWDEKHREDAGKKSAAGRKRKQAASKTLSNMGGATPSMGMSMASATPSSSSSSTTTSSGAGASKKMIPGWTIDAESGGIIGGREPDSEVDGWRAIGNSDELTAVYNGEALHNFYQRLFERDEPYASRPHLSAHGVPSYSTLPSCTWLRAKGPGEVTAEHADYYYFAKNTSIFGDYWSDTECKRWSQGQSDEQRETCQLCKSPRDAARTLICDLCERGFHTYCVQPQVKELPAEEQEWHCPDCMNRPLPYWTCWTPLGDIAAMEGRLALIAGSHRLGGYHQPARDDLLPAEYTRAYESKSVWQTPSRLSMGDVILFNLKTIHAATRNGGERFRLSLDTRVTTGMGRRFRAEHEIEAIEAKIAVEQKKNKKQQQAEGEQAAVAAIAEAPLPSKKAAGKAQSGSISSIFVGSKKQKAH